MLCLELRGDMRRREFITVLGATATWPLATRAQQPAMPVVGFLNVASAKGYASQLAAFIKGLGEVGYVEGRNVAIEYRWGEYQNDRLPAMAADLVQRKVAVIAATSTPAALAAKAATTTIPIVFEIGADPIQLGLVRSLNRPDSNVTGVSQTNTEIAPKRLELLHQLLPTVRIFGLLVNPANPILAGPTTKEVQAAASALGLELHILNASTAGDFDGAFARLTKLGAGGLVIGPDPLFSSHGEELAALAARYAVPAIFENREFALAGGLTSYSGSIAEAYRLAGVYTGRVLKGDKPADLPVQRATKVELYINLKTAKALGIAVPLPLSGRADIAVLGSPDDQALSEQADAYVTLADAATPLAISEPPSKPDSEELARLTEIGITDGERRATRECRAFLLSLSNQWFACKVRALP
jgi:putative ABC transport system substrate-binding protein